MAKIKHQKQTTKNKEQRSDETEELKNKLARALADYQNLAKRFEKEKFEIILRANAALLENLLPIVDSMERASSFKEDEGLKIVLNQMYDLLEKAGIEEISPKDGEEFNALEHEAVDSVPGGKPDTIAQVYSKGYKWKSGQVILRPAKVTVYSGKQSS